MTSRDGRRHIESHVPITLAPGLTYHPDYLDRPAQEQLLQSLREITRQAPLFTPRMPRTGKPFSVRMTNCGRLGWVSDVDGLSLPAGASRDRRALARHAEAKCCAPGRT